jgi:hypothetical protein
VAHPAIPLGCYSAKFFRELRLAVKSDDGLSMQRCNERITGGDDEAAEEILDRLERHVTRCPLSTFTFDGLTEKARQRADGLRAAIKDQQLAGKIKLH